MLLKEGGPHFHPFLVDETTSDEARLRTLSWLKTLGVAAAGASHIGGIDLNRIFSDLTFAASRDCLGLQLADIVASACTRAFNGTLSEEGWGGLGSLLVARKGPSVHFVELSADPSIVGTAAPLSADLASVVERIDRRVRGLVPDADADLGSPSRVETPPREEEPAR